MRRPGARRTSCAEEREVDAEVDGEVFVDAVEEEEEEEEEEVLLVVEEERQKKGKVEGRDVGEKVAGGREAKVRTLSLESIASSFSMESKEREDNAGRRGGATEPRHRVFVSARVRPVLAGEVALHVNQRKAVQADFVRNVVSVWLPPSSRFSQTPEKTKRKTFQFDQVFDGSATQGQVFNAVAAPIVDAVLQGMNGCLLAYGQTGAGKTFTTFGPPRARGKTDSMTTQLGLIPRAAQALFQRLDDKVDSTRAAMRRQRLRQGGEGRGFSYAMYITYYQIYLDSHIQDLFEPGKRDLQIRLNEDSSRTTHQVDGLSVHRVTCVSDVLALLDKGERNKVVSQTAMNATSSRSHCVFTIQLVQHVHREGELFTLRSKMTCVDLAGSERVNRTHPQGLQLAEAKSINRSLSALGNVIAALSTPGQTLSGSSSLDESEQSEGFIPWRDSKLTRVLQESLDGTAQVSLVINVSPDAVNVQESINSLLFGRRSMSVALEPQVNNVRVDYKELSHQLQLQLDQLRDDSRMQIAELEDQLVIKSRELESLRLSKSTGLTRNTTTEASDTAPEMQNLLQQSEEERQKLQETHDLLEDALIEQLEINAAIEAKLRQDGQDGDSDKVTAKVLEDLKTAQQLQAAKERSEFEQAREHHKQQAEQDAKLIRELKEQVHALELDLAGTSHRVMELQVEHGDATAVLLTEKAELGVARDNAERQVAHLEQVVKDEQNYCELQLCDMESKLQDVQRELDCARAEMISATQHQEQVRRDLEATTTKKLKRASAKLRKLKSEAVAHEESAKEWQDKYTQLVAENDSVTSKSEHQVRALEKSIEGLTQERDLLESKVESLMQELTNTRQERDCLDGETAKANRLATSLQEDNTGLRGTLSLLGTRLEQAEAKLEQMTELHKQERALYESLLQESSGKLSPPLALRRR
ncbi:Chromosome-associated kinesin KIF4A (Chromokinesin-A) [Durusdinium trenchii]|uniref:Chromosome-associated kinesin KIF4A (Chromokinesin-A) n=1 Tax=Durusdinium trenchii TaxID=1381693 RepID=A0ABP0SAU5_9DINO